MRHRGQIPLTAMALLLSVAGGRAAAGTIPAGATITVRLVDSIDSRNNYVGETFRATVDTPLMVDGQTVVPRGAEAIGRLTVVEHSGRIRGRSMIAMELTALNYDGKSVSIQTGAYQEAGDSRGKQTAKLGGGGAVIGTLIGAIAGGAAGSLIGAGVGAAGGAIVQTVRGSQTIKLPAESLLVFTLQSPIPLELGM